MSHETIHVRNNPDKSRYEVELDGHLAKIDYRDRKGVRYFIHTEVPPDLEGRGIAGAMAKFALDEARAQQLAIVPQCPFVRSYIERHPEYQSLVKIGA